MTTVSSKWLRVSGRNQCPVCGKPDWCLISQDGTAAICPRIRSDKQAGDAGWLHRLTADYRPRTPPPKPHGKQLPLAPVDRRDAVYRALLGELTLSRTHTENLLSRGLTAEQIEQLSYRTLPVDGRADIVARLTRTMKVGGVPGFALVNGVVTLRGAPGILIPVRDTQHRIRACQIRIDHADGGRKYRWLSSASKPFGCSPGAPCHVARPLSATESTETWITEGCLKADIAAIRLNRMMLAVPGVGNWRSALPVINELKPSRVVVCFDMDKLMNPTVDQYKSALINHLLRRGIRTFEADWNTTSKGIDDLLTGDESCRK